MKLILLTTFIFSSFIASAQRKITWSPSMNISTNAHGNSHPRMTLDRVGNPLVIWGRMSDQAVFFSRWTGSSFTAPMKLNPSWLTVATASWMGPDIASYGDTIYVVVKRTPEASDTNRMFILSSFDGGQSFNNPVEVGMIADSISRFPTVTTDAIGNPIVAFMKFNPSFLESRWAVIKSTDYGKTFSNDTKASGWGDSEEVCDCCPGAIISEGNTCVMMYRNNNSNLRDTWAGISSTSGSSFTSGLALENNNWVLMSCPSTGPDGVIIGDTLYSTFMNGISGIGRTYLSKSSISAGTMSSAQKITGAISGLSEQNYPRIASDGTAMAIVWKQSVNGSAQLPILFTNNIAEGFPASYDTVDLANITNSDVSISNGNIYVVWQDDNTGTVKFRSGTYTPTSTNGVNTVSHNRYSFYPNPFFSETTFQSENSFKNATLALFDNSGKLVKQMKNIWGKTYTLHRDNLQSGLYFFQLIQNSKVILEDKLIIID